MQLTVLRIALAPVFFVLFAIVKPVAIGWAVVVFIVAAISDWWDGHIARKMNLTSTLGAFLDPLADKFLTGAAFIAFAWCRYVPWWMVAVVLMRDVFLTVLRVIADRRGVPIRTTYFAKVKTTAQMVFILLVLAAQLAVQGDLGATLSSWGSAFFVIGLPTWLMGIITILTIASGVLYGYQNWHILKGGSARARTASPPASHESV